MTIGEEFLVLIIDDNKKSACILSEFLIDEGYSTQLVHSGAKAITSCEHCPPDLVILEIHLPDMDGFELFQQIKKISSMTDVPVIFLTAMSELADKVKAFKMGAADFITKPYHFEEVKARIRTQRELLSAQRRLAHQNENLEKIVNKRTRKLVKSMKERQLLLNEVHHRVFNNLQVIQSLLVIHKNLFPEKSDNDIIRDFSNHISIISEIHKFLYESDNFMEIEFQPLIHLMEDIFNQDGRGQKGAKHFSVRDAAKININLAIPLGSAIYELLNACCIYNTCEDVLREIRIDFSYSEDTGYLLEITDNGRGIETYINYDDMDDSHRIMLDVFLNQLKGDFAYNYTQGTRFKIQFPDLVLKTFHSIDEILG